jgi:murein DD-endopeptidase MepM/ murein hydrolase activator NlpD
MDNYTLPTSSMRTWPVLTGNTVDSDSSVSGSGQLGADFQQMLTTLLLGLSTSGSGTTDMLGGSTSSATSGLDMNSLLAPLMFSLIEQILSQQLQNQQSTASDPATSSPSNTSSAEARSASPTPNGMPLKGPITQYSHPGHIALDVGVPVGTDIHATMDGKVVYAGWNNEGYGNLVIVENGPYKTYFAHQSKIDVSVGQTVHAGDIIGQSGNTGNSTGPHLHYEVRKNGQQIDPSSFTLKQ